MRSYVSLLPDEYRQELHKEKVLGIVLRCMILAAVVLAVISGLLFTIRLTEKNEIEALNTENEGLQKNIAALDYCETLLEKHNDLTGRIGTAMNGDKQWLSAVSMLADSLPRSVWINTVSCTANEQNVRICALECGANTLDDVANTLTALKESEMVADVICTGSSEAEGQIVFQLTVTLTSLSD